MNYNSIKERYLGIGEIFNISFDMYKKNIKIMILIALTTMLPMSYIFSLAAQGVFASPDNISAVMDNLGPLAMYATINIGLSCLFTPLMYGGLTSVVKQHANGQLPNASAVLDDTLGKIQSHLLTSLLSAVITFAGSMLFIVPGIYLGFLYFFSSCVVAETDLRGMAALKASSAVIKGRWFRTLGFIVMAMILQSATNMAMESIFIIIIPFSAFHTVEGLIANSLISIVHMYFYLVLCLWFMNKYYVLNSEKDQEDYEL